MRLSGVSMGLVRWTIRGRLYGVWLIGIGMRCWPCRWELYLEFDSRVGFMGAN